MERTRGLLVERRQERELAAEVVVPLGELVGVLGRIRGCLLDALHHGRDGQDAQDHQHRQTRQVQHHQGELTRQAGPMLNTIDQRGQAASQDQRQHH